jgi:hypothetical protein
MASLPGIGERIASALADRFCELLSETEFRVEIHASNVTVTALVPGHGEGSVLSVGAACAPAPCLRFGESSGVL